MTPITTPAPTSGRLPCRFQRLTVTRPGLVSRRVRINVTTTPRTTRPPDTRTPIARGCIWAPSANGAFHGNASGAARRGPATGDIGSRRLTRLRFEQVKRAAFDGQRDEAGLGPAGVDLPGVPANAPPGADRHALAIRPGRPALARDDQEKLGVPRGM